MDTGLHLRFGGALPAIQPARLGGRQHGHPRAPAAVYGAILRTTSTCRPSVHLPIRARTNVPSAGHEDRKKEVARKQVHQARHVKMLAAVEGKGDVRVITW
eukprot:GHVU01188917.1.p1 GENE.GHVU01188917.1~~GHVU01188917.1.p1  ORF type:complete len:101 (-),score=9.75 GHVU01188917.1:262-564(-)